jgi:hypothetical protein
MHMSRRIRYPVLAIPIQTLELSHVDLNVFFHLAMRCLSVLFCLITLDRRDRPVEDIRYDYYYWLRLAPAR